MLSDEEIYDNSTIVSIHLLQTTTAIQYSNLLLHVINKGVLYMFNFDVFTHHIIQVPLLVQYNSRTKLKNVYMYMGLRVLLTL